MKMFFLITEILESLFILLAFGFIITIIFDKWKKIRMERKNRQDQNDNILVQEKDKKQKEIDQYNFSQKLKQEEGKYINIFLKTKEKSVKRITGVRSLIQEIKITTRK